jgi:hypothetical protein
VPFGLASEFAFRLGVLARRQGPIVVPTDRLQTDGRWRGKSGGRLRRRETVKHTANECVRYEFHRQDGRPKADNIRTNNVENVCLRKRTSFDVGDGP